MNTKNLGIICGGIFLVLVVILAFFTLTSQTDKPVIITQDHRLEVLHKEKCNPRLAYDLGKQAAGEDAYMLFALAILASYSDADSEEDIRLRDDARAARTQSGVPLSVEARQENQEIAREWHKNNCPALVQ